LSIAVRIVDDHDSRRVVPVAAGGDLMVGVKVQLHTEARALGEVLLPAIPQTVVGCLAEWLTQNDSIIFGRPVSILLDSEVSIR